MLKRNESLVQRYGVDIQVHKTEYLFLREGLLKISPSQNGSQPEK